MDLCNERGQTLWFATYAWILTLIMAEDFGWSPDGTTLPDRGDEEDSESEQPRRVWNKAYDTNDGQLVSAEDASRLADGLEHALAAHDYVARGQASDKLRFERETKRCSGSYSDDSPCPFGP